MKEKRERITCDIVESIAILHTTNSGWKKELNRISWDGGDPKFDIRSWSPDKEKFSKGVALSLEEAKIVANEILKWIEENE